MKPKNYPPKTIISCLVVLLITAAPLPVAQATTPTPSLILGTTPDICITEIQTASATSASEEFIELFNLTDHPIDFADTAHNGKDPWKLQYFSGSKLTSEGISNWSTPTGSIDLAALDNTVIAAHDYYLLAAIKSDGSVYQPGGIEADGHYSAKLSDNTGLQLVDVASSTAVTTAHDRAVWQKPATGTGVLAAPGAGASLQRIPNDDDEYLNDDGSLTAMEVRAQISPKDLWLPPTETTIDDGNPGQESDSPSPIEDPNDSTLQPPAITELLPNPATPLTDAADEFIELYNPNPVPFNVQGFTLETGTTTLHDFTFTTASILAPHSYQAFYSADTHLSLSNSGGQVRLLNPAKQKVSETAVYSAAADGKAWALLGDSWQWTAEPTPGAGNVLSLAVIADTVKVAAKSQAKVKGINTVKTVKTSKPKTVKAKQVKATKTKKKTKKTTLAPASSHLAAAIQPTPIHAGVLAAVAGAAVLYALYEYRLDLANYLYRCRNYRPFRRRARR